MPELDNSKDIEIASSSSSLQGELKNEVSIIADSVETLSLSKYDFNYEMFLRRMRHPSCRPLLTRIKTLINRFKTHNVASIPAASLVHVYRTQLDSIIEELENNPVWRLVGETKPEEFLLAREGLEYLIMGQIHSYAFLPTEDREKDALVTRNIAYHTEWILGEHLDIKNINQKVLNEAIDEFVKVNEYLTPRDKLICFLNGCKVIQTLFKDGDASADEIMSLLIYTILKSKVKHYYGNLQYISRYRDQRELANDRAYHFTSLLAVATFIERMDHTSLIISEQEYTQFVQKAKDSYVAEPFETISDEKITSSSSTSSNPLPSTSTEYQEKDITQQTNNFTEERLKEDASKLFELAKEKIRLGASKSIELLGDLMDKAEAKIKAAVNSRSPSIADASPINNEERERALAEEDEFQLNLAMALSLSELEQPIATTTTTTASSISNQSIVSDDNTDNSNNNNNNNNRPLVNVDESSN